MDPLISNRQADCERFRQHLTESQGVQVFEDLESFNYIRVDAETLSRGFYRPEDFYHRLQAEKSLFQRQRIPLVGSLVVLLYGALIVFRNLAFYRYVPGNRLKDLGYEVLPELSERSIKHADDPIVTILLVVAFILFGAFLGPQKTLSIRKFVSSCVLFRICGCTAGDVKYEGNISEHPYLVNVVLRMSCIYSLGHLLRAMTYMVTTLPGSADHCLPGAELDKPKSLAECFYKMQSVNGACGDLIFSGHMLFMWLAFCFIFKYGAKCWGMANFGRFHKCLLGVGGFLVFAQSVTVIMSRHHYSVDVVVASYTAPMLFHFYNTVIHTNDMKIDVETVEREIVEYSQKTTSAKVWINVRTLLSLALFVFLLALVVHGNFNWVI